MATTTENVNRSRAATRTLAAAQGWTLAAQSDGQDDFVRGDRAVKIEWAERGWFNAPAGRFLNAYLIDRTVNQDDLFACVLDTGSLAQARAWLVA